MSIIDRRIKIVNKIFRVFKWWQDTNISLRLILFNFSINIVNDIDAKMN